MKEAESEVLQIMSKNKLTKVITIRDTRHTHHTTKNRVNWFKFNQDLLELHLQFAGKTGLEAFNNCERIKIRIKDSQIVKDPNIYNLDDQ